MAGEVPQGEFGEAWWKLLHDTFTVVDIGAAVSTLFAVKDKQEQVTRAREYVQLQRLTTALRDRNG